MLGGNGDVVVIVPSGGGGGGGEDDGYVGDAADVPGGGGGGAGVANAGIDGVDVSGGRGSDWWFYDSAVRRKMARGVPVFRDESLFDDLSDLSIAAGSSTPWSREASRAAAEHVRSLLTSSGAAPGHETEDAPAYRFFVGGAACQDADVYLQLVATSGMCDLYRDALTCEPREHGAAPWAACLTECEGRRGGVADGPPLPIVGSSRDPSYRHGVDAALAVLGGGGGGGLGYEFCSRLLDLCVGAGALCPVDSRKVYGRLCGSRVRDAVQKARSIGAGGDDVDGLVASVGRILVWRGGCCDDWDADVMAGYDAGADSLVSAVEQHHGDALLSVLERERAAFSATTARFNKCFQGRF